MNKLSVIIPFYNSSEFLEKSIQSIFQQSYENIEYIFVNDCSTDNSVEILESLFEKFPTRALKAKLIHHEKNKGSGAARNTGLLASNGDFIIFFDSDDWVELELYEKMIDKAIEKNADIVCCGFIMEYDDRSEKLEYEQSYDDKVAIREMKFDLLYSSLCNKIVRKHLYTNNKISFYKGIDMWEDVGVMSRLRVLSENTVVIRNAYYHYNKLNFNSIVSVPTVAKIQQEIRCAELLKDFFLERDPTLNLVSDYLRFVSKSDFLFNVKIKELDLWRSINNDTHKNIMKFRNIPYNMRLISWVGANISVNLARAIVLFKNRFLKS
ncbi:Poly-beta-1,6-N-acetyl-D-glucosamine synthase [Sphingobacterium multivorum]|uniref:glycosyltransferase family 2 protein n=1 Tax=Sphingobacterium multivorum TaxID=28454 RepID=UPI000E05DB3B|nr:glycosyltransferase family 2 protein [Sphingobacterium multivorum]QQT43599.1 glycosyltransferase family 2 protein [Sphingobacterium multivorum]SUI97900.1 Poly-beta-1,6-N-acetyl-D-glucosamine synthase [Sphingobacterium multivorum]